MKLCLLCTILGLGLLYAGVHFAEARVTDIGNIGEDDEGTLVSVSGEVQSRYYTGEHLFFTLADGIGKIKVVIFESSMSRLRVNPGEITNGMEMEVEGIVKKYRGELEIVPERIYLD